MRLGFTIAAALALLLTRDPMIWLVITVALGSALTIAICAWRLITLTRRV